MTSDDLVRLGTDKPVMYRGGRVLFLCLSMRLILGATRKQPLKAHIRRPDRRELYVSPSQLTPVAETTP